jgi:germination protein M
MQGQLSDKVTYFVPVTRLIPRTDDVASAVIQELLKGPLQGSTLYSSLLPSVNVLSVKKENDTITVNFDNKILSYNQGEANPSAITEIILSLTENTDAKKIQLLVDGKKNLKAGNEDYSKPVTRPTVINPSAY